MAMAAYDDIDRPARDERDGHYKPGSIKRVKLRNFLTYDAVEFEPGPRLNVVVGPNGTGKSTILCAICLGLGGQPPLLGRADDARLFIKHERDQAIVEIELAPFRRSDGRPEATHVIKRVIDRDRGSETGRGAGASTYFVNGHKSNLKSVKELVSDRYKISIDNLCTFLPQDKVGNFSGFDKQALLLETEKSLSSKLYNTHQELIELEKALQSTGTDAASIRDELDKLKKENERLEREKELMEERKAALEKIELLKAKLAWLICDAKRAEAKAAKELREELKKKRKAVERDLRPLKESHAAAGGEVSKIQSRLKALDAKAKKDKRAYEDLIAKADRYSDDIHGEVSECATLDAEKRNAQRKLEKERARLAEVEAEGRDFPSLDEIESASREAKGEMCRLQAAIGAEKHKQREAIQGVERANEEREAAASRLKTLQNDKKLRLQKLFKFAPPVGQAHKFIDENRKMFRKPVYGPIAAEVLPNNPQTASYLEQHVSTATWKSYVVGCKEDYDLLFREVREKRGIPINIVTVERIQTRPRIYSENRMELLRREHGFNGYLDETYTAPDVIMQALINKHNVDKVLVGGEAVHNSLERKDLVEFLSAKEGGGGKQASCFFYTFRGASFKYTSQVSRYTGEVGTDVQNIVGAKLLKPGSDPRLKDELAAQIKEAEDRIAELRPQADEVTRTLEEMNKEGATLHTRFNQAKRTKQDYQKYRVKLRNQKDKLEEAEENASKDNDREKAKKIAKIKKLVENSITMNENAAKIHTEIMKSTHILTGVKMAEDGLSEKLRKLENQLAAKEAETAELADQYAAASAEYDQKKSALQKLRKDAEALAPQGGELFTQLMDDSELPANMEELEDMLDEFETKANSITDNPHVMRQYEERKRDIEKFQKQLDEADGEEDMKKQQLDHKLRRWEASLINIVNSVSEKFSEYMKEVGCAGEVKLFTAGADAKEGVFNFKQWGVEIRVKFRESSTLQVLSAQTHSGGERSVSTIMYLMGLQNLMSSPFRCVDEINQGLDERNERLVFKRIVANSTLPAKSSNDDHCGQYFLITPKLLPNLDGMENENITVLFVFSGTHNFETCLDWNVDKFIEDRKRFMSQDEEQAGSNGRGKKKRSK